MYRISRSELAGIEGIVKLKHLDDSNMTVSIDTTDSSDALNPKTKLTMKNATLPLDAKLNGFQDYELKRLVVSSFARLLLAEIFGALLIELHRSFAGRPPTRPIEVSPIFQSLKPYVIITPNCMPRSEISFKRSRKVKARRTPKSLPTFPSTAP